MAQRWEAILFTRQLMERAEESGAYHSAYEWIYAP
jgi:hypothetical protein